MNDTNTNEIDNYEDDLNIKKIEGKIICNIYIVVFIWLSFFCIYSIREINNVLYIIFSFFFFFFILISIFMAVRINSLYELRSEIINNRIRRINHNSQILYENEMRSLDALNLSNNITTDHINNLYIFDFVNKTPKTLVEQCCVCLDKEIFGIEKSIYKCSHNNICTKCIKQLIIKNNKYCPLCRSELI